MKVDVYGTNGKATGRKIELPDEIFGIEPNEHAVYLDVKAIQANGRQGTHKAKERGEIAGSTKKIKRQKGTGTARAGSIKNPLFKGGGRVFGPRPRSYGQKLNKKVKRLARISALSAKSAAGAIKVVEDFTFDQPKTNEYVNVLKNLELANSKTLLVVPEMDKNLVLSQRNVKESRITLAKDINTLEIMKANTLLISEASVDKIKETLSK
jgi:large subunit ribosomal protein L4